MGKNTTGGNKQKSKKNHIQKQKNTPINEITPDNTNRFVAKVIKTLGSSRLSVESYPTGGLYNALIPGSFRNRIWINTNDYVLIEIASDITGNNCYIVHKYDQTEIDELVNIGALTIKTSGFDGDICFSKEDEVEVNLDEI